jgi:ABC-type antimicrobial peptide transport system permease subunit
MDILTLIFGESMTLALLGILIGLVGAYAVTRVLNSLLFGVSSTDPLTFAAVSYCCHAHLCSQATSPPAAPPASIRWSLCATNEPGDI